MNKIVKFLRKYRITYILTLIVIVTVALGSCKCSGCSSCKSCNDTNSSILTLSTQALDGVFNPFFYTSGYDGEVVGMTQISMLGTDDQGDVKVGKNEATVVLDYTITPYDEREDKTDKEDYENYYTTYQFLIKNNIKFSDGTPLTIKDVLFNMYVYLDPVYSGSTTMYSVNIKGLDAYRADSYDIGDQKNFERRFEVAALERRDNIVYWADDMLAEENLPQVLEDIEEIIKPLFLEELKTDWNSAEATITNYSETFKFTEAWQVFLYMYGIISVDPNAQNQESPEAIIWNGWDTKGANWVKQYGDKAKDQFINMIYEDKVENAVEKTHKDNIKSIVKYYNTGTVALARFKAEAISEFYDDLKNTGGKKVPSIEGITTYTTTDFNGSTYQDDMSVLQIVVNGVDPKAIWNFGFTVAPMHYYSTAEQVAKWDGISNFGVDAGSSSFMRQIQINDLPMGAGPYMATDYNNNETGITRTNFFSNNIVNYRSNPYFLLGEAKTKYVKYKVISSNKLYEAVKTGEVHYADPSAKIEYVKEIDAQKKKKIDYELVENLGYGYIGINAKYVNELEVRRAMMYAMDTSLVLQYYTNEMASVIHRSMSKESWAYPKGATAYYPFIGTDDDAVNEIIRMVESVGYTTIVNKVRQRRNPSTNLWEKLEFTFTLAGETNDHPAYNTFKVAKDILEKAGFKITIAPDPSALTKLSSGGLQVWAAAWSSTIDPDMYQVYHRDSKATSIINWGYPWIKENGSAIEKKIIDDLSDLIDQGRSTTVRTEREVIYANALNKLMELAVELPTYQRKNLYVYNCEVIDASTLQANITPYNGPLSRIWEVQLKK